MKKFILWLARVSGVESSIEDKERKRIANDLINACYWWNESNKTYRPMLFNAYKIYGEELLLTFTPNMSYVRNKVYEFGQKRKLGSN